MKSDNSRKLRQTAGRLANFQQWLIRQLSLQLRQMYAEGESNGGQYQYTLERYRLLNFGTPNQMYTVMVGTEAEIDKMLAQHDRHRDLFGKEQTRAQWYKFLLRGHYGADEVNGKLPFIPPPVTWKPFTNEDMEAIIASENWTHPPSHKALKEPMTVAEIASWQKDMVHAPADVLLAEVDDWIAAIQADNDRFEERYAIQAEARDDGLTTDERARQALQRPERFNGEHDVARAWLKTSPTNYTIKPKE